MRTKPWFCKKETSQPVFCLKKTGSLGNPTQIIQSGTYFGLLGDPSLWRRSVSGYLLLLKKNGPLKKLQWIYDASVDICFCFFDFADHLIWISMWLDPNRIVNLPVKHRRQEIKTTTSNTTNTISYSSLVVDVWFDVIWMPFMTFNDALWPHVVIRWGQLVLVTCNFLPENELTMLLFGQEQLKNSNCVFEVLSLTEPYSQSGHQHEVTPS